MQELIKGAVGWGLLLFPLIWPLIIVAFLSAVTWGMLMGTLFDYRKPLNSWLGGMTAATGVVWVVSMAALGVCVLLQPNGTTSISR